MSKTSVPLLTFILKWTVFIFIFLNLTALCTLPFWLGALYGKGFTYLLSGGYFLARDNIRYDYNLMLIFIASCGTASLVMLVIAFKILKRMCLGLLFHEKNANGLKYMAYIALFIMLMGIMKLIFQFTLYTILFITVFLLAAVFLLVLSQIFVEAGKIKKDNDLVI